MPPVVCKFWQQGSCRNGDRCKFLHTDNSNPNNQPLPNGNRYAALQGDRFGSRASSNGYQGGSARAASPSRELPYSLDKKTIQVDLTSEKPQWILSAYGPGRHAPAQLFGGPMREHSFEEMRLLHYMAVAEGNPQQAVQAAERLWQASEQQIQTAANNIDGAINFIISSEKEHPNRIDIVRGGQVGAGFQPNPFNGQPSFQQQSPVANPFAGASQSSQGAPAFGAPSALGGAFGQTSALGQKTNAFGTASPAFGAPTQLGATGFGQPSALGQKANPFGAPAAHALTAVPFSSFTATPNPFRQMPTSGAPTDSGTANAFQRPPQPATSQTFGAPSTSFGAPSQTAQPNPFSQPSNPNASSNPFGGHSDLQPNSLGRSQPAFGDLSPTKNPFGAPTETSQALQDKFVAHAAPQQNPFAPATIALVPVAVNPFGPSSLQTRNPNPFGHPVTGASSLPNSDDTFAPQSQAPTAINGHGPNVQLGAPHPQIGSYISRDSSGKLSTFKGKHVDYKGAEPGFTSRSGLWERIWFPEGPPMFNKDTEVDEKMYDDRTEAAYLHAKQTGSFPTGIMPMLPPKREWCHWDF
ncbi:hypothetical protein ONS95_006708 [Cadophora gregata]|uniref:uncharacterized protein n=1 Tax=Cadophora gregata TaxID=51156 RepID=UPI0026DB0F72|nr:uncharacterized protein ONS95_006708 [Cadophora gregata]KAK0101541.1 hypothetical protein ONS95_006708 [Cadophora gregata]KAK0106444.1 hypothetical protein ONS96_004073 [Cadophora gregata f. sp. sojae]